MKLKKGVRVRVVRDQDRPWVCRAVGQKAEWSRCAGLFIAEGTTGVVERGVGASRGGRPGLWVVRALGLVFGAVEADLEVLK